MISDSESKAIRKDWVNRQRQHGNEPRAVLMKNLPDAINNLIDRWHRAVMRSTLGAVASSKGEQPALDLGCGYGRLADTAAECGLDPLIGLDFSIEFCRGFQATSGPAVCGSLPSLPFRDEAFHCAYSITALMYLPLESARQAILELDRCVKQDGLVLLIEPSLEFNSLVRSILPGKRGEKLAMPGFSRRHFQDDLTPTHWRQIASGGCTGLTLLLPVLLAIHRLRPLFRCLARLSIWWDRPPRNPRRRRPLVTMYHWTLYRKS